MSRKHFLSVSRRIVRLIAFTVAAQVEGDDSVVLRQALENSTRRPDLRGIVEAVNEHDGLAGTLIDVVEADAVSVDVLVLCNDSSGGECEAQGRDSCEAK